MPVKHNITASCVITKETVYKNGQPIFINSGTVASDFFTSIYKSFNAVYTRFYKMDNLSKLGWLASEVLLKDNFIPGKYSAEETGLVLANANVSLDTDIKYFETVKTMASPSLFVYTLPNIMIGEICIRNHFKGETAFFVSEQFDAGFMKGYVSGLLDTNILQACICGWVELLENEYKAVLYLIEKEEGPQESEFTIANLNKIFALKI